MFMLGTCYNTAQESFGASLHVTTQVLVLNQSYEPLNVCSMKRAFGLVFAGKAEVLELRPSLIRTPSTAFPLPSVIRILYPVRRPRPVVKLTRREIFVRDRFTCQYCGVRSSDLTLDHVTPRHRGGRHVWENLVSACKACNHRKGGHLPHEARMKLLRQPAAPRVTTFYAIYQQSRHNIEDEWKKFLPVREAAFA